MKVSKRFACVIKKLIPQGKNIRHLLKKRLFREGRFLKVLIESSLITILSALRIPLFSEKEDQILLNHISKRVIFRQAMLLMVFSLTEVNFIHNLSKEY